MESLDALAGLDLSVVSGGLRVWASGHQVCCGHYSKTSLFVKNCSNNKRLLDQSHSGGSRLTALKSSSNVTTLDLSKQLQECTARTEFEFDLNVANALIDMHIKHGSLETAHALFCSMPVRDTVTWNTLITGYSELGHGQECLDLFEDMQKEGMVPDRVTFICLLKACCSLASLEQGLWIHVYIIDSGYEFSSFVGNSLISMYAKCGSLENARMVFNRLHKHDVVTWTALITGYIQHGHGQEALLLFEEMQEKWIKPNSVTFVCILKACSNIVASEHGRHIHALIIGSGFELDGSIGSTLIDMYGKCGCCDDACVVFERLPARDVVSWSALIVGQAQCGRAQEALDLFKLMQMEGVEPNPVTYLGILKACSCIQDIDQGRRFHACVIEHGFESVAFIGSTLIDMYGACGELQDSWHVFERLSNQNMTTWSVMISRFVDHGRNQDALQLFKHMQQAGLKPNHVTFFGILKACSNIAALEHGRQIHAQIIESGLELDSCVCSSLMDMYGKCGSLADLCMLFERLPNHDAATVSALIGGCAHNSHYLLALQMFKHMQKAGVKPDSVAFLVLLSACSHAVLVDEGCRHFKSMREDYGIVPSLEHYNSLVDLLSQAGYLDEAEDLLQTVPFSANIVGWMSLLNSSKRFANVDLGRQCFEHVVQIDQREAAAYVLMSNIYAQAGMQENAEGIEELRRCSNAWKKPAEAFIEIDNQVHGFIVGDTVHPQIGDIYTKLRRLSMKMKEEGYEPNLDSVLTSNPRKSKEDSLLMHSEKLAIAFGLISTAEGTTIRIAKNLRICEDCHMATKIISKIEMRDIIVSDAYCIHWFQDGKCSCEEGSKQK